MKNARTTINGAEVQMTNRGVFDVLLRKTIRLDSYLAFSRPDGAPEDRLIIAGQVAAYDDYPSGYITLTGKFQVTDLTAGEHTQAPKLIMPRRTETVAITDAFEAIGGELFIGYIIKGDGTWLQRI